jgi:hypothetical protein
MDNLSFTQSITPIPGRKKILYTIVFDVSGSMEAPLKLRSRAQDADQEFDELEPKRVQTVFNVICRLAEDGIDTAKDHELYAAVLCFGLRDVSTCDLLALIEELVGPGTASALSLPQVTALLSAHRCDSSYAREVTVPSAPGRLYKVFGWVPLVKLLADFGAPYSGNYVRKYLTEEAAGMYFTVFSAPERAIDLRQLVSRLPVECKQFTFSQLAIDGVALTNKLGLLGDTNQSLQAQESRAATDAIQFAHELRVLALLRSIPNATPIPLKSVLELVKPLQLAAQSRSSNQRGAPVIESQPSSNGSQAAGISWEQLLDDIEQYLYGGTPMCEALQSVGGLFQVKDYSSKIMILISDGESTDGCPFPSAQAIRNTGGMIFACLLTDSDIKEPRQLRGPNDVDTTWHRAARDMFSMASTVSYDSGPVQALRRRGWKIPTSGLCKLFVQANNPTIIDDFVTASRSLGNSSDALADMLGQISLDTYIRNANDGAQVTDQRDRGICWAHASASVIHLASHRVVGRIVRPFSEIRAHLLKEFGDNDDGQNVGYVLGTICPSYRLRYQECDEAGARAAIHARRPVIATFTLDSSHWQLFSNFYHSTPKGTLTKRDLNTAAGRTLDSHAVVLVRCDETSLTFMNSWGPYFANNGFFTVDRAVTLQCRGRYPMRFYDVFWVLDDLSEDEKAAWKQHERETVSTVAGSLPPRFHELPVNCPRCQNSAPAQNYDGSWDEARCRACGGTFTPTVLALIRSLYDSNYSAV